MNSIPEPASTSNSVGFEFQSKRNTGAGNKPKAEGQGGFGKAFRKDRSEADQSTDSNVSHPPSEQSTLPRKTADYTAIDSGNQIESQLQPANGMQADIALDGELVAGKADGKESTPQRSIDHPHGKSGAVHGAGVIGQGSKGVLAFRSVRSGISFGNEAGPVDQGGETADQIKRAVRTDVAAQIAASNQQVIASAQIAPSAGAIPQMMPIASPDEEVPGTGGLPADEGGSHFASDKSAQSGILKGAPIQPSGNTPSVRALAIQVAQAAASGAERTVEITLDPAELGKVRLTLNASESGMSVQILGDRAETLELMRKNTAALEAEFQKLGYQDVDFMFSQGGDNAFGEDDPNAATWLAETDEPASVSPVSNEQPMRGPVLQTGLDLRL